MIKMRSSLLVLFLMAAITAAQDDNTACVGLVGDEVCITKGPLGSCRATWNGIPCESCTICGTEEDSATAYTCEVASIVASSNQEECNAYCPKVVCDEGCKDCTIAPEDIPAALELYEQEQALADGVEGEFPVVAPGPAPGPEGDFPVVLPAPTNTTTDEEEEEETIDVVIDNNTNEATQQEEVEEVPVEEEGEGDTGDGASDTEEQVGIDTQTDANANTTGTGDATEGEGTADGGATDTEGEGTNEDTDTTGTTGDRQIDEQESGVSSRKTRSAFFVMALAVLSFCP